MLVQTEIEVAPLRYAGMPFQHIAGEVEVEEFDFLFDGRGEPIMHWLQDGGQLSRLLMFGSTSAVSRIDPVDAWAFAPQWRWLLAFPVRQCASPVVRCDQVDQMCCSRPRKANDDDR